MAVPKRKTTPSRAGMRRSHGALKPINTVKCSECGALIMPHNLCRACGSYAGRPFLVSASVMDRRDIAADGSADPDIE